MLTVTESTYDGQTSSLRLVVDTEVVSFGDDFGISFRTRDVSGIIFMIRLFYTNSTDDDYMLVALDGTDGHLEFETSFGPSKLFFGILIYN